jgi:alpha-galactosidase
MSITEAELLENAQAMRQKLAPAGYCYVVMDAGWFNPAPELASQRETPLVTLDEYGRLLPAPARFPSSAGGVGLREVSRRLHALGLKLGIHMMRGIPRAAVERNTPILGTELRARDVANLESRCTWNQEMYGVDVGKPGGQAYYDSVARLLAKWEIDFIKGDDLAAPYHADEIAAFSRALGRCERDILFSLSPGGIEPGQSAEHARRLSEMQRVSKDLWDEWVDEDAGFSGLKLQFDVAERWQGRGAPGYWPDLDMLPMGQLSLRGPRGPRRESRLTRDEQISMLTLWAMFGSPFMIGGELTSLSDDAVRLLTNASLLRVQQQARNGRQLWRKGEQVAWRAELPDGAAALALFNLGDRAERVALSQADAPELETWNLFDVWQNEPRTAAQGLLTADIPAHGARLLLATAPESSRG